MRAPCVLCQLVGPPDQLACTGQEHKRGRGQFEPAADPVEQRHPNRPADCYAWWPGLAAELGVTPNQLMLAWLLHQTEPTPVTLIGPRTPEQLDAALDALEIKLTEEQLARLEQS